MSKYQTMPDIAGDKWDEFRKDILENGVKVPVIIDEDGDIIDGHQRYRACVELGIDCPMDIRSGLTEDEKNALILSLNYHRRQLTPQQQHEVSKAAAENYKRRKAAGEKVTQEQVAMEFGTTDRSIKRALAENRTVSRKPETPTAEQGTELQQNNESSAKRIIYTDIYPLEGGRKGYQIKTTDGFYFFKQNRNLKLCELIRDAINKKKYIQDPEGVRKAKSLANGIVNQQNKTAVPEQKTKEPELKGDTDFSFLIDDDICEETEETKEFNSLLDDVSVKLEWLEKFTDIIRTPVVAEFIMKSIKEKLSQYPDIMENSNNPDRKAFVNVFNMFKKLIRGGE